MSKRDQTQADELETKLDNFVNGLPIKATEIGWEAIREQQQEFLESIDHYANQRALELLDELEEHRSRNEYDLDDWIEMTRKRLNLTKETE